MKILSYRKLRVYRSAIDLAMEIFELTKSFPPEEKYSITDQIQEPRPTHILAWNLGLLESGNLSRFQYNDKRCRQLDN